MTLKESSLQMKISMSVTYDFIHYLFQCLVKIMLIFCTQLRADICRNNYRFMKYSVNM